MAELIYYVNNDPANSPGGTGLTNATSGTDRAFFSPSEAEALNLDLVTGGNTCRVICSGPAESPGFICAGWSLSTTNYLQFEAASGDRAVKTGINTGKFRIANNTGVTIQIQDRAVRLDGLQILNGYDNTGGHCVRYVSISTGAAGEARVTNCYLQDSATQGSGINIEDVDVTIVKIHNNIIRKSGTTGGFSSEGIYNYIAATTHIYNNVIWGFDDGIECIAGTNYIKNNAVFNNTDDFDLSGGTNTVANNASDDGDGTNPIAPSGSDWANEFVSPSTGDFTLKNTGNLYDAGIGPSSDTNVWVTDIDGDVRSGSTCDIGADEYAAAGGGYSASLDTAWGIINSATKDSGWAICAVSQADSSWALFNAVDRYSAAAIKTAADRDISWRDFTSAESDSSWSIFEKADCDISHKIIAASSRDISWIDYTLADKDIAWSIVARIDRNTAWQVLSAGGIDIDISWRIAGISEKITGWAILDAIDRDTAFSIYNGSAEDTAWAITTVGDQDISWPVLAAADIDSTWKVFNVADVDLAAAIITMAEQDSSWVVFNKEEQSISWDVFSDIVPEPVKIFMARRRSFIMNAAKRTFIFFSHRR